MWLRNILFKYQYCSDVTYQQHVTLRYVHISPASEAKAASNGGRRESVWSLHTTLQCYNTRGGTHTHNIKDTEWLSVGHWHWFWGPNQSLKSNFQISFHSLYSKKCFIVGCRIFESQKYKKIISSCKAPGLIIHNVTL